MKRLIDIILSVYGIIILAPFFLIIAIVIKLDSAGPALFLQERIGQNGRKFRICKFRTMKIKQDVNSSQITIGNDNRITRIGNFLRKYKIDELPQLFNVLAGQMSLVGPRPEVAEYVNYYSQKDKDIVLSVQPGITDLASIRFRNESEILAKYENPQQAYINKILPRKLRYYRFYVRNKSLQMDSKIICMTVNAILRG